MFGIDIYHFVKHLDPHLKLTGTFLCVSPGLETVIYFCTLALLILEVIVLLSRRTNRASIVSDSPAGVKTKIPPAQRGERKRKSMAANEESQAALQKEGWQGDW